MDTTIPSHFPAEDKETPTVKWNVSFRVKKNVKNNYKILKKEKVQYFRRDSSLQLLKSLHFRFLYQTIQTCKLILKEPSNQSKHSFLFISGVTQMYLYRCTKLQPCYSFNFRKAGRFTAGIA